MCYGYGLFTGGLGADYGAMKIGATAIPMSAGNTARQLMTMEDFGATAIACTPSYALYLAETARDKGIIPRLKIKTGIHGAEPWTEEMRDEMESIFGYHAFDIYGLCEILGPGVAQDCIHRKGLHIWEDYFLPEVLNPQDQSACADGEVGELVITTLTKEAMPLLRYRTKAIKKQVGVALRNVLGLTVEVQLVEPMGITRSEGKAVRVIDNRVLS